MAKRKKRLVKDVRAIGEFIISFSQLEYVIRVTFELMMGLSAEQTEIVLANYDFAALCRASKAYVETLPEKDEVATKRYSKLISECLRINTERVRIVHGTWHVRGGPVHLSRNTFRREQFFDNYEDLVKLVRDADKAFDEFATIVVDRNDAWGPIVKFLHEDRAPPANYPELG
jgi:hypothetical protein